MVGGVAFDEVGNNDCDERDEQEPPDELEDVFVRSSPDGEDQAFEEFSNGQLEHP